MSVKMADNELKREFEEVKKELINIGSEVKIGFGKIFGQIESIVEHIGLLDKKMVSLDSKIDLIEDRIIYLGKDVLDLKRESMRHSSEISGLANHIDQKFEDFSKVNNLQVRDQGGEEYKP